MIMLTSLVLAVVLCLGFAHMKEHDCRTPDSASGTCINLQECASLYAMANNFEEPMTIEKLTFLMKSQCGFNGANPKVCCPKNKSIAVDNST